MLLQVVQQPGAAFGGEKFNIQPIIQVVEGGLLNSAFNGSAYVQMDNSAGDVEPLYIRSDAELGCTTSDTNPCGWKVTGRLASVTIMQGVGSFKVLYVSSTSRLTRNSLHLTLASTA